MWICVGTMDAALAAIQAESQPYQAIGFGLLALGFAWLIANA